MICRCIGIDDYSVAKTGFGADTTVGHEHASRPDLSRRGEPSAVGNDGGDREAERFELQLQLAAKAVLTDGHEGPHSLALQTR